MASFAMNDQVCALVDGETVVGRLVDINMLRRLFKLETEHRSVWITQQQIVSKI